MTLKAIITGALLACSVIIFNIPESVGAGVEQNTTTTLKKKGRWYPKHTRSSYSGSPSGIYSRAYSKFSGSSNAVRGGHRHYRRPSSGAGSPVYHKKRAASYVLPRPAAFSAPPSPIPKV